MTNRHDLACRKQTVPLWRNKTKQAQKPVNEGRRHNNAYKLKKLNINQKESNLKKERKFEQGMLERAAITRVHSTFSSRIWG